MTKSSPKPSASSQEWKSALGLPSTVPTHKNPKDAPNLSDSNQTIVVYLSPEDARDKVLCAIVKALLKTGNVPSTPKELCGLIQKGQLANLGISQLYKRCSESKPPRMPILGKWAVDGERRLRYYVDQPPIPWNPVPETRLALGKSVNVTHETLPPLSDIEITIQPINHTIPAKFTAPLITDAAIGKTASNIPTPVATQAVANESPISEKKRRKKRANTPPAKRRRISSTTREAAASLAALKQAVSDEDVDEFTPSVPMERRSHRRRALHAAMDVEPQPTPSIPIEPEEPEIESPTDIDTPKAEFPTAQPVESTMESTVDSIGAVDSIATVDTFTTVESIATMESIADSPDPYSQDEVDFNPIATLPPPVRRSARSVAVSVNVSPEAPKRLAHNMLASPTHPGNHTLGTSRNAIASPPQGDIMMVSSPRTGRLRNPRRTSASTTTTPSRIVQTMYQNSPDLLQPLTPIFGIAVTPASVHKSRSMPVRSKGRIVLPEAQAERENGTDDEDASPSPLKDDHAQYKLRKFDDSSSGGAGGSSGEAGAVFARSVVVPMLRSRTQTSSAQSASQSQGRKAVEFVVDCMLQSPIVASPIVCFTLRGIKRHAKAPEISPISTALKEEGDTDVEDASPKPKTDLKRRNSLSRDIQVVKDYVAVAVSHSPEARAVGLDDTSGYSSAHDDGDSFFNFSGDEVETMISKTVPVSPSAARTALEAYPGLIEMRAEYKSTHTPHIVGLPGLDLACLTLIPPISLPSGSPPIFMTVIDKVACFLTFLPPPNGLKLPYSNHADASSGKLAPGHGNVTLGWLAHHVPVLRRMDNNAIDVSCILLAGGLLQERERDSALALELQKVKVRRKKGLMGTWVPLVRARDYARSYVLETKLGTFLSDGLLKSCFGMQEDGLPVEIHSLLAKKGFRSAPTSPSLRSGLSPLSTPLCSAPASPLVRPMAQKDYAVVSRLQALVGAGGPLRPSSPLAREVNSVVRSLSPGLEDDMGMLKPSLNLLNATLTSIATGMTAPKTTVKIVNRNKERKRQDSEEAQPPSAVVTEKFMIHLAGDSHFPQVDVSESPKTRSRKRSITMVERVDDLLSPVSSANQDMMELEKLLDAGAYLEVEVTRKVMEDTVALGVDEPRKRPVPSVSPGPAARSTRRRGKKTVKKVDVFPPMAFFTAGPSNVVKRSASPSLPPASGPVSQVSAPVVVIESMEPSKNGNGVMLASAKSDDEEEIDIMS